MVYIYLVLLQLPGQLAVLLLELFLDGLNLAEYVLVRGRRRQVVIVDGLQHLQLLGAQGGQEVGILW